MSLCVYLFFLRRVYTIFLTFNHCILMSLCLYVQIVDGIKNATATQLDVADIGSLSDLVSQVNFILIVTEQVLFHNLQ